jgi:hypothetical protein
MAMATTQLARVIHFEDAAACQREGKVERKSLPMSRIVATGKNGRTGASHAVGIGGRLLTPSAEGSCL